jgi:hypothetical protein
MSDNDIKRSKKIQAAIVAVGLLGSVAQASAQSSPPRSVDPDKPKHSMYSSIEKHAERNGK